jgi:radical SAM/Cys-rich protein
MHDTLPLLIPGDFPQLHRGQLETLQVNLGYLCNQSCLHCHVNAGPGRKEVMTAATVDEVIRYLQASGVQTLDLTGGAPELNPGFRRLVSAARAAGVKVIDRCNLTVLLEPGQQGTAEFLAENKVEIVASLPCYLEENVDRQRGEGCFSTSIRVLRQLNGLGYARELPLNLMYNPQGPSLPPPQAALESDYKKHLAERYDVHFSRLLTLTNMPIRRFGSTLVSKGGFDDYMNLLREAHKDENLADVMCRSLVSIDWEGHVYDCDFNQMLGLPVRINGKTRPHITDLIGTDLTGNPIAVANHCYACTAGQGSGCGGALEA